MYRHAELHGERHWQPPANFAAADEQAYPLMQTFRIVSRTNYARTVFIEKLQRAGVTVARGSGRAKCRASRCRRRNS